MSGEYVAGWYPDPMSRYELRFHNGERWTADVSSEGDRFVDPLGIGPSRPLGGPPVDEAGSNRPAALSLGFGIAAIVLGWIPIVVALGIVATVLALVFGIAGRRRAVRTGHGRGLAQAGLIIGAVGIAVCAGGVAFTVVMLDKVDRFENPPSHDVAIVSCENVGGTTVATGQLTNLDSRSSEFNVRVAFVRPGTDNARRQATVDVGRVEAGATVGFEVVRSVDLDAVECVVAAVRGPLPYGIDPGI